MAKKLTVKPPVRQASLRSVQLWTRVIWLHRVWHRKRRLLTIGIKSFDGTRSQREFIVLAVEGPRTQTTDVMTSIEETLGDHKHKTLGSFTSEHTAMQVAEAFGNQWLLGRSLHRCSCLPPRKLKKP